MLCPTEYIFKESKLSIKQTAISIYTEHERDPHTSLETTTGTDTNGNRIVVPVVDVR